MKLAPLSLILLTLVPGPAQADQSRYWPAEALPKGIVRTETDEQLPHPQAATKMLLQSLAGLAAQGVNEGRGDELVWTTSGNRDVESWYGQFMAAHPEIEFRGTFGAWELVDRYRQAGLVKGYILYRADHSARKEGKYAPDIDLSINVATSLAGILGGVVIEESLEPEAQKHQLTLLLDARGKTDRWVFDTYKDQLNRHFLFTQDPNKLCSRDYAIAHRALALFAYNQPNEPGRDVMEWLEPLSPIAGWNGDDEQKTTKLSSSWGHFQTCTDWTENLPVLMAGLDDKAQRKAPLFDPATIDWNDKRSGVSYVLSDGDNIQWWESSFFHNEFGGFWSSPDRGRMPFGWSCPFSNLLQVAPQPMNEAVATRTPNDWFLEWGGGYFYPDLFATERPDRWDLLGKEMDRIWAAMKDSNTQIVAFNLLKADSPDALKAYATLAARTDGLLAIFVFQYDPYEGGHGQVFWVKDGRGVDVPVVTCHWSIWGDITTPRLAGTPARVARMITEADAQASSPQYDWVICHAWSVFRKAPGSDEQAEEVPTDDPNPAGKGVRGYTPAWWSAQRLPSSIHVMSPPELAWRLRMQHDPAATSTLLRQLGVTPPAL